MKKQIAVGLFLMATLAVGSSFSPAFAKKWTVTQRIDKLSAEVKEGRKAYELTDKQVDILNKDIADVQAKINVMKQKNAGQLSIPDTRKVHQMLNDISINTLRYRLENVYFEK